MGAPMRLKEIVAEACYLEDMEHKPEIPFSEQDSNVRDYYHRVAADEIPSILSSYFRMGKDHMYYRFISGCITDFMNQHGNVLNDTNKTSLIKRLISRMPAQIRSCSPDKSGQGKEA